MNILFIACISHYTCCINGLYINVIIGGHHKNTSDFCFVNRYFVIPITTIKQGAEPPTFTGWFQAWDAQMWDTDPLERIRAKF